jgi:hypothetical protein
MKSHSCPPKVELETDTGTPRDKGMDLPRFDGGFADFKVQL